MLNTTLKAACPALEERLGQWRSNDSVLLTPFRASPECTEVSPNFTKLNRSQGDQVIIFLDDTSRLTHQAQQLKLASLGQLTAAIAHEVRNPLGAISHAAQLLMESESLEATDRKMTDIIQHHCLRVNGIIENVLQLSRRNTAMIQPLQLAEWVEKFIANFTRSSSEPCKIDLSGLVHCWVQVDPNQLTQVLTNLVENGLRYSQQQTGKRTLSLRSGHSQGSDIPFLEVIDEGPGIPDSAQARLFEPFYTSEASGTGLGLYIARELCEINHASLSYINKEETGACFRITFAHSSKLLAS
jgi:two-component system sensor histidine kinase PilS (NtrC family)